MSYATFAAGVHVDEDAALRYAEATLDDPLSYRRGTAPPLFALVLVHRVLEQAGSALLAAQPSSPLVLHSEQELRLTRPVRLGEQLNLTAALDRAATRGPWSEWVLSAKLSEDGGRPVVHSRATLLTPTVQASAGSHGAKRVTESHPRRLRLAAGVQRRVTEELLDLYVEASGDRNPIHVSDAAAQAVGLPGRVVHGLLTLAVGGAAAAQVLGGGDPTRLSYIRCRFTRTVAPGTDVTYRFYTTEVAGLYDFSAVDGDGHTVLKRARLQLGSDRGPHCLRSSCG